MAAIPGQWSHEWNGHRNDTMETMEGRGLRLCFLQKVPRPKKPIRSSQEELAPQADTAQSSRLPRAETDEVASNLDPPVTPARTPLRMDPVASPARKLIPVRIGGQPFKVSMAGLQNVAMTYSGVLQLRGSPPDVSHYWPLDENGEIK